MPSTLFGYTLTINNPTDADRNKARGCVGSKGISYIIIGNEVGEEGTPHIQGYFQANHKDLKRFKDVFPRGHIERANGSDEQNHAYCSKGGDFWESGERAQIAQKKGQGKRSDLDALQQAIRAGDSYDKICDEHFKSAAKYSKFIKERVLARDQGRQFEDLKQQYEDCVLRPWQRSLMDRLESQDERKITWVWESRGNVGKSWMTGYLQVVQSALVLDSGKFADMAHIFSKVAHKTECVVFDLSRTLEKKEETGPDFLKGIYKLAENLKNGRLISGKYDGESLAFKSQTVVFFANFPPDRHAWSEDRYDIVEI